MQVPFVDLFLQYKTLKAEIDEAIASVITETAFIGGKYVNEFEREFARLYRVNHVISCANGTDSLFIIMKMLGIGVGDEVITVANSWISSSETISQTGATPVFVDVHPLYYSLDETQLDSKITSRTKALIAVHLQGQMCEMNLIKSICDKHSIHLIEDCAQSHFSSYQGTMAGLFGIASSFSFYPGKNLGAYGDAGCIITNDLDLASKCAGYARHGALKKHQHLIEGINSRLDGMQAAILLAKLPHIIEWTDRRIANAALYNSLLSSVDEITLPKVRPKTTHSYHLFVVQAKQRDELMEFLRLKGVETSIHYPSPLPFLPAYKYLGHQREDFPVAAELQGRILSLPMFAELSEQQICYTVDCIREFYRR